MQHMHERLKAEKEEGLKSGKMFMVQKHSVACVCES